MKYYMLCESHGDVDQSAISVGYSGFNLGVTLSEDEKDEFCTTSRGSVSSSSTDYQIGVSFFQESLPTIDRCLELAGRGWTLKSETIGDDTIGLSLSYTGGPPGGQLNAIDVVPPGALTCEGVPAELSSGPIVINSGNPVALLCSRQSRTIILDGVEYKTADAAAVSFRLGDAPMPVKLPAYTTSRLTPIERRVSAVESRVEMIDGSVSAIDENSSELVRRLSSGRNRSISVVGGDATTHYCGDDQVVIGLRYRDMTQTITMVCGKALHN